MRNSGRWLVLVAAFIVVAAACGDDDSTETTEPTTQASTTAAPTTTAVSATTAAPTTTAASATTVAGSEVRTIDAVQAAITIDGDSSDWDGIVGLDLTLDPIKGEEHIATAAATVKVAYDDEFVYMLFTVDDDFNWDASDGHKSGSSAAMWSIDSEAGTGMGSDAEGKDENDEYTSLGMVDIWHWELECGAGVDSGGATGAGPGDKDPGNDSGCNFDDEWSSDPATREDDNGAGAENSLLGVFSHSNPVADGEGTWTFEMRRPLQTGDATDAQFGAGHSVLMGVAYWDADNSPEGWDDDEHVNSATQGWIQVNF